MTRPFVLSLVAIALFFAGSVAVVVRLTARDGRDAPAAPALAAAPLAPAAAPTTPTGLEAPPQAPPRPAAISPPVILPPDAPALGPKPPPAWLAAPTRKLGPQPDRTPLGPLRPYVADGLARLRMVVAECADEAPPDAPKAGARRGAGTTLTLKLESLDNQLRIAEVTVADAAAASDWRVACAQRKLRGKLIPAPTKPGTNLEVPFVLSL